MTKLGLLFSHPKKDFAASAPPSPRNKKEELSSSSSLVTVAAELQLDDDARRQLVAACRQVAPDVTDDEIADFTHRKLAQLRGRKQIDNLVGLMLVAVPRMLAGSDLQRYREGKAAEAEQFAEETRRQAAITAAHITACESILGEPCRQRRGQGRGP